MAQLIVFTRLIAKGSIAVLALFLLAACSGPGGGSGAASQQELMDKAVQSISEDDYAGFLKLIPPDDREDFVVQGVSLALMPMIMMSKTFPGKGYAELVSDFGHELNLKEEDQKTPGEVTLPKGANLEHAFVQAMRLQQGIWGDDKSADTPKVRETSFYYLAAASDIKISEEDANTATAEVTFPLLGKGTNKTLDVTLVQLKGRWYLKMSPPLWPWSFL